MIETLELSDCYNNVLNKGNNIKITIYLNKLKSLDFENVGKLIEIYFYIVDKLANFKPSNKTKEKFFKNWENFKNL